MEVTVFDGAAAAAAAGGGDPVLPEGSEVAPPAVGMEFATPDAARIFYSAYAERLGFRVRSSKSFTSRVDDTVIMRRFVCSRQGRPTRKDPLDLSKKRRNRPSSREGCRAMLQVNRRPETGTWAVSRCVADPCHPLGVPPSAPKKPLKKPWDLHTFDADAPPPPGLGPGGGAAQSMLEYFKRMQVENPAFFYAVQLDSNNCVSNMLWVGTHAKMAYSYFGDAVTLDTSCRKNKRMVPPFVAFTGVNHHRQGVVFGCAFMTDESEASWSWLFETWMTVMSGRRPKSLIIPCDSVMEAAAVRVFSNVRYRFCKMDMFSKSKEKLTDVYMAHPLFKSEFKRCVDESESVDEFEASWGSLLGRYYLEDNMWLGFLYDIRQKWIPAYFRGTLFAELPGVPKVETMHKFFQRHSITTTTLRDLVTQFDKAMAGQYEKEVQADFITINTRPVLKTTSSIEKQASDFYTRTIFEVFQEELVRSSGLMMNKFEDGVVNKFHVMKVENAVEPCLCTVTYIPSEKRISCSCCMFEFSGILCRHVFRVLLMVGIQSLPEGYILRRWTRNAKNIVMSYGHSAVQQSSSQKALNWRCNELFRDAIRFAEEGATSAVIYKVAKGALQKAFNEVDAVKKGPLFNGTRS